MISKWGTPKTPAPSGPLTLYVGPSRDAGRLRARQDRHRAAAPALSNGDGLSKQTHSAVLAPLRGSGRVALSRPPVDRSAGERPTILGSLQMIVSLSPVGGDVPCIRVRPWSPYSVSLATVSKCTSDLTRLPRRPASSLAEFFSLLQSPSGPLSSHSISAGPSQFPPAETPSLGHLTSASGAPANAIAINRAVV